MVFSIHTSQSEQETLEDVIRSLRTRIERAHNESARIAVFLSGGSVIPGYRILAEYMEQMGNAEHITLLLADERWDANPNHADSNARQIEEQTHLFSRAEACGAHVMLPLQGGTLEEDALIYNERVGEILETHTCIGIFGVGADSHTTGLLPALSKEDFESVFAQFPWYAPFRYPVAQLAERLTLTPQAIARMHEGIVYAVGENKKDALKNFLHKQPDEWPQYPAILLRQIPKLRLFTDQDIKKPA